MDKGRKELEEKVRQYEGKLATLTVINGALQNENDQLRKQLEDAQTPTTVAEEELQELKEEFTRRLGAANKTIASLKDERERLKGQVTAASQGGTATEARLQERDNVIATLQAEGEQLSRRAGELEATVRKLRASVRETEADRDRLAQRVGSLEGQLSREQERAAQAAQAAAAQMEELDAELESTRRSAAKQLSDARREAAEARTEADAARGGAEALAASTEREATLAASLADARRELEAERSAWAVQEEALRREVAHLEEHIRQQEAAALEAVAQASEPTRPLLRTATLQARLDACEQRLAQTRAQHAAALQRAEADCNAAHERLWDAEEKVRHLRLESAKLQEQVRSGMPATAHQRKPSDSANHVLLPVSRHAQQVASTPATPMAGFGGGGAAEHGGRPDDGQADGIVIAAEQAADGDPQANGNSGDEFDALFRTSVPAAAHLGQIPLHGNGDGPTAEEAGPVFERGNSDGWDASGNAKIHNDREQQVAPTRNGMRDAMRVALLEERLRRAEAAAEAANVELLAACERADAVAAEAAASGKLRSELQELEGRMGILLELLGERNERVEQLEVDVAEMKAIFRDQLSSLVDALNATNAAKSVPEPAGATEPVSEVADHADPVSQRVATAAQ